MNSYYKLKADVLLYLLIEWNSQVINLFSLCIWGSVLFLWLFNSIGLWNLHIRWKCQISCINWPCSCEEKKIYILFLAYDIFWIYCGMSLFWLKYISWRAAKTFDKTLFFKDVEKAEVGGDQKGSSDGAYSFWWSTVRFSYIWKQSYFQNATALWRGPINSSPGCGISSHTINCLSGFWVDRILRTLRV